MFIVSLCTETAQVSTLFLGGGQKAMDGIDGVEGVRDLQTIYLVPVQRRENKENQKEKRVRNQERERIVEKKTRESGRESRE